MTPDKTTFIYPPPIELLSKILASPELLKKALGAQETRARLYYAMYNCMEYAQPIKSYIAQKGQGYTRRYYHMEKRIFADPSAYDLLMQNRYKNNINSQPIDPNTVITVKWPKSINSLFKGSIDRPTKIISFPAFKARI